jgi:hypothetical protein
MRSKTKPTKKGATILKLVPASTRRTDPSKSTPAKIARSRSNGTTVRPSRSTSTAKHIRGVRELTDQLVAIGMKRVEGPWKGDEKALDTDFSFMPVAAKGKAYALIGVGGIALDFKARVAGRLVDWRVFAIYATGGGTHTSIGRWSSYERVYRKAAERGQDVPPLLQTATVIKNTIDKVLVADQGDFMPGNLTGLWLEDDVVSAIRQMIADSRKKRGGR